VKIGRVIVFISLFFVFLEAKMLDIVKYDPFKKTEMILQKHTNKKVKLETIVPKKSLVVDSILNNKAHIDGKFYGKNKIVYGYKILDINDHYIKVKKNGKMSIIPLVNLNNIHIAKNKGQK